MTPELHPAEEVRRDPVAVIRSIGLRDFLSGFGACAAFVALLYFAGVMFP